MKEFVIDNSLKIRTISKSNKAKRVFLNLVNSSKPIIESLDNDIYHKNYIQYLMTCWENHYGHIVTPDLLWYTIVSEVTRIVKDHTEEYRDLFSTSSDKIEIDVLTHDETYLPLDSVITALEKLVPSSEIIDMFCTKFSTTTVKETFAYKVALCDTLSVYYKYNTFLCGFSKVKVFGTLEDYKLLYNQCNSVYELLIQHYTNDKIDLYFTQLLAVLTDIIENFDNSEFWGNMVDISGCGSGHWESFSGWLQSFYYNEKKYEVVNMPSHVAQVDYKCLSTGNEFSMMTGLFGSNVENDYLIPEFSHTVYKK